MVEVQICGKTYPLCLTVAALDEVSSRCGGLNNVGSFMDGVESCYIIPPEGEDTPNRKGDLSVMASNATWLLGVLLREGENNRQMRLRMDGQPVEPRFVPDCQQLTQLLTVASAIRYRTAVFNAITESMNREIEAVYPKNVKDAEQE